VKLAFNKKREEGMGQVRRPIKKSVGWKEEERTPEIRSGESGLFLAVLEEKTRKKGRIK